MKEILKDSLTEKGMRQWWFAQNRYLNKRPCQAWCNDERSTEQREVLEAAHAFAEGAYL